MKVLVTGGGGLVGRAVVKRYEAEGHDVLSPPSIELNLLDFHSTKKYLNDHQFDLVIHCAARVGGVYGNLKYPATFINDNLTIQNNLFSSASKSDIPRLVFVASSCIYPPGSPLPLSESSFLSGKFERTNRWYAMAKAAGIMQIEAIRIQNGLNWFSVLPTNVYGPNDNFALETGHVVPSLLRKFAEATLFRQESVIVWGSGRPYRELIHVDDLADAIHSIENRDLLIEEPFIVNVGSGDELSIFDLAQLIKKISQFKGEIVFDQSKPDGVFRKTLDTGILDSIGWKRKIDLETGLRDTFDWVLENFDTLRKKEV